MYYIYTIMINLLKILCLQAIIKKNTKLCKQITLNDINIHKTKEFRFGHFQFNNIIKLFREKTFEHAIEISSIIKKLIKDDEIDVFVTKPGFINFKLNNNIINRLTKQFLNKKNYKLKKIQRKKIIIDY